jgi:hypothetical protein
MNMKKFFALIIAVLAVGIVSAQPAGRGGEQGQKKSPVERIAHVTEELGLTEKQAEKFAPVYLAYQSEISRIRKDLKKVMEWYNGKELTEKLAFRKAMDQLNADADIIACKKEYLRVFKNHLTPEQLAKVFTIERRGKGKGGKGGKGGPQGPQR